MTVLLLTLKQAKFLSNTAYATQGEAFLSGVPLRGLMRYILNTFCTGSVKSSIELICLLLDCEVRRRQAFVVYQSCKR
jgi:hypothetical protein